jgi:Amt family ammonium transporter
LEKAINAAGTDGLLFGNAHQLGVQALSLVVTVVFAAIMTFVIFKIVDAFNWN